MSLNQTVKFSAVSLADVATHFKNKSDEYFNRAGADGVGKTDAKVMNAESACYAEIANVLANLELTGETKSK